MKQIYSLILTGVLASSFLTGLSGCCFDEPVVVPPVIDPQPPTLLGMISTNEAVPVEGAQVTATGPGSYSAASDSRGIYSTQIEAGSYNVSATWQDMEPQKGEFTAENDQVVVWNAVFPKQIEKKQPVTPEGGYFEIPVPPLTDGSGAQNCVMTFTLPPLAVAEDDELVVVFWYDADIVKKMDDQTYRMSLIKVNYYLKSGRGLQKPIDITVPVPAVPAESFLNGHDLPYTFTGKDIAFNTQETGLLVLNYDILITKTVTTTRIAFDQSEWDNIYGSDRITVGDAVYHINLGGTVSADHILLKGLAEVYTGVSCCIEYTGHYPINTVLPVGTKLTVKGTQDIHHYTFSVAGGILNAWAYVYGAVRINVHVRNVQHIGGSN